MAYQDPTFTHQQILDQLGEKWVEIDSGRIKAFKREKRKLPKYAFDPSPSFVVRALSEDEDAADVKIQFLLMHGKTPFDVHFPQNFAFDFVAPSGETFFIFFGVTGNGIPPPCFASSAKKPAACSAR